MLVRRGSDLLSPPSSSLTAALLLPPPSHPSPSCSEALRRGASNLPWVDTIPQVGLNVYSILQRDYLVITRAAADLLAERLRRPIRPNSPTP